MKRLRILPEMWANTSWPLVIFTLNMVPARTAETVPSTSTALSSPPLMPLRILGPTSGRGPEGRADLPCDLPAGLLKFAIDVVA